jgi:hypothetical protein
MNRHRFQRKRRTHRAGQALIELVISLVAFLAIVVALLQIGQLTSAHMLGLQEARARADALSLSDTYLLMLPNPRYIQDWNPGPDGIAHTRDDQAIAGSDLSIGTDIVAVSNPSELNRRLPGNRLNVLGTPGLLIREFDLVRGDAQPRTVPLLSAAQHLLYAADSITVEADSWMVWARNIP